MAGRAPISGGQLLLALLAIGIATVVLPAAAASRLNAYRVAETQTRANDAAAYAQSDAISRLLGATDASVVCGPGLIPKSGPGSRDEWTQSTAIAPQMFRERMPTDAWGQCFLINPVQLKTGGRVWVLSAGPNGLIDTPLGSSVLMGDDVGAIVR